MRLEIVEPVREWLRKLRKDDPELARQIADVIQTVLEAGPGIGRPLVDSLAGSSAKMIRLKEMRTSGTVRIAFVYHGGVVLLLLACGDKRGVSSEKFYTELVAIAAERYRAWLQEQQEQEQQEAR